MSQTQSPDPRPERRSQSVVRHRRESFWQITFPMLVVLIVLSGVFALIALSGPQSISSVADASLVLVSLPLLVIGLLVLAVLLALLFGLGWLLRETPAFTGIAQDASARISGIVQKVMEQATNVIVSALTGFSMARDFLGGNRKNGSDDS